MKTRTSLFLLVATLASAQFRTDNQQYTGAALPPRHLVVTFDDGPSDINPSTGVSQTQRIAELLNGAGVVATFFQVGCHFATSSNPGTDALSSACMNGDTHPVSFDSYLLGLGHIIGNHTWYHVPLTTIKSDTVRVIRHVKLAQQLLDAEQPDGLRLFRAPGLAFDSDIAALLNRDSYLGRLTGPIGMDVDATAAINGVQLGGDAIWFANGMRPEDCAADYLQQIQQQCSSQGCVVLIHDRTEREITTDWAFRLTRSIFQQLGPAYTAVPPDAIPGILGNTRLGAPRQWTTEFGANDGVGAVVPGDLAGSKKAAACKVRNDLQIWCALPAADPTVPAALQAASPWLAIADPEWAVSDQRFWLADLDGDGAADLIYATSRGVWAATSNRRSGFGQPQLVFATPNGWDMRALLDGIRFGNFFEHAPGPKDLFVSTPAGIYVAKNFGNGFGAPQLWSSYAPTPAALASLQVSDLNADGFDDVVAREPNLGQFLVLTTHKRGFGGSGFDAPASWFNFAGQTNPTAWNDANNSATIHIAHFGKRTFLTAGATTGIVYSQAGGGFSTAWRHLCNECYTTLSGWHAERAAIGIVWADLDGSGSDSAVFTRASGLDVAPGTVIQ